MLFGDARSNVMGILSRLTQSADVNAPEAAMAGSK
jgi:hypothetical protein